ncbi:hypothetical protein Tco_1387358 [Tanacetum coccineum]
MLEVRRLIRSERERLNVRRNVRSRKNIRSETTIKIEKTIKSKKNRLEVIRPFEVWVYSRHQHVVAEEESFVIDLEKNERYYKPAASGPGYIWGPPE